MNCKPGDLAFVINDDPGCESNIGRIVRVIESAAGRTRKWGDWSIEPTTPDFLIWSPASKKVMRYGDTTWAWIVFPDKDLRPIRPNDGEDETLTWAGKPETVTA